MDIYAGLAPLAGYSDLTFRELCSKLGSRFSTTEMISSVAVCNNSIKTMELAEISESESPCAIQIFGHVPEIMAESAEILICSAQTKPIAVDINFGCPVKKIVTSGDGSALLNDIDLSSRIVKSVKKITEKYGIELWSKMRTGWDSNDIAMDFSKMLEEAGCNRITVHGKTKEQMYRPGCDLETIGKIRESLSDKVKVIGNGDVCSISDAQEMIRRTNCDGVAIGRAACSSPWIFRELNDTSFSINTEERIKLIKDFVSALSLKKNIHEVRGRCALMLKGIRNSTAYRDRIHRSESLEEINKCLDDYLKEKDKE